MRLLFLVRLTAERDVKAGEILELHPTELYTKPGYGEGVFVAEVVIPKPYVKEKTSNE